jgi:hypothetical protein
MVLFTIPPTIFAVIRKFHCCQLAKQKFNSITVADHGLGRDMWTLKASDITDVLMVSTRALSWQSGVLTQLPYYYLGEIFYIAALIMFKVSILCFILSIFPARNLRVGAYVGLGISIAYGVSFLFATIFQCAPVSMAWNRWDGLHNGKCNNIKLQGWMCAAFNIVIDIYILVLPLRDVSKLNMNIAKKLMLLFMFSLGIL